MSKPDVTDALRASRSTSGGAQGSHTRNVLVIVEVALSVVLLVSAGLTIRTFLALQNVDPGIDSSRVLMVGVPLPPAKYATLEQRNRFGAELLEKVRGLPTVEAATFGIPIYGNTSAFTIAGQLPDESKRIEIDPAGADHLRAFGIQLKAGRMFTTAEVDRGDRVAVINEAALKLWPTGTDPIGGQLRLGILERATGRFLVDTTKPPEVTIVGVVSNSRNAGLRMEPMPAVVIPYSLLAGPQRLLVVRTSDNPNLAINAVRAQVRAIDSEQPLGRPVTLNEVLGEEVVQSRFTMALFSVFAGLGLALAAVGIYSVLSFHVTRRTHELGVRMALGAPRRHVLQLMLMMGGRLVALGLAVGVVASIAATRLLSSQLFGVAPGDLPSYVAVTLLLAAVTFAACYVPARRAAAVDPMVALRLE